jgi:hypothetical protein
MYAKQPRSVDPLLKEKDKCDLAEVIALEQAHDCLTTATAGKIIEHRLK